MTPRRLYVSDMDGTLLDADARLSDATRAGLLRLLRADIPFTVATARSPQSIAHILDGVPLTLPVIALHGAILSDLTRRRHVRIRALSAGVAEAMLGVAREHGTSAWISTHDGELDHVSYDRCSNEGMRWYEDSLRQAADPRRRRLPDVAAALDEQVVCFTVIDREPELRAIADDLRSKTGGAVTVHLFENAYSPGWWWINAHASDAGKDAGVRDLVQHAGLGDHEITSFGDTSSDLHLFSASQRRVAVANADDAVRAAADETIEAHTADSVVRWILRDAGLED